MNIRHQWPMGAGDDCWYGERLFRLLTLLSLIYGEVIFVKPLTAPFFAPLIQPGSLDQV